MGYFVHSLLHVLIGASLTYVMCNKDFQSKIKRSLVFLFGGIAAILPDVPKFFGDIWGHTIWITPVFGLLLAIVFRLFIKELTLIKSWVIFTVTVLIGHIFIDYIENGVALFHPVVQEELEFNLINSNDMFVLYFSSIECRRIV